MALSVGARLGSYEIVSPIGTGGLGELYRVRDTRMGRQLAVKALAFRVSVALTAGCNISATFSNFDEKPEANESLKKVGFIEVS